MTCGNAKYLFTFFQGSRGQTGQNDCLAVNVHTTNKFKKEPLLPGKNFNLVECLDYTGMI
jgi:hypothetical protein